MGQFCVVCSSRGAYEQSIKDFFSNMKLRKITHKSFTDMIKKNIGGGKIAEKKWLTLVDNEFGRNLENMPVENYKNYWAETYTKFSDTELDCLILSITFLLEKNLLESKKAFTDLSKAIFKKKQFFQEKKK